MKMTRRLPVLAIYSQDGRFLSKFVKVVLFSNGRYTKGVSLLSKMVYKRVRSRTSRRSLPVLNFVHYPPGEASLVDQGGPTF